MSRIGKLPISIPAGVTVSFDEKSNVVTVKGPKGELSQKIDPSIKFTQKDNEIVFEIDENSTVDPKQKQAFHGLYRSLVNNMVVGVSEGYKKELELVGVGYRVSNQGNLVEFSLGYTHSIFLQLILQNQAAFILTIYCHMHICTCILWCNWRNTIFFHQSGITSKNDSFFCNSPDTSAWNLADFCNDR